MDDKYIITGAGKCGTTFLMQLFTNLGLNTGFTKEEANAQRPGHGGLEWEIRGKFAHKRLPQPKIIKNPRLCTDLFERAERWDWNILHVYICIRDPKDIATHRVERWKNNGRSKGKWKGITEEEMMEVQMGMASANLTRLMYQLADTLVPYTFIKFPQSVKDSTYLRWCLRDMVRGVNRQEFHEVHKRIADPSRVRFDSDGVLDE